MLHVADQRFDPPRSRLFEQLAEDRAGLGERIGPEPADVDAEAGEHAAVEVTLPLESGRLESAVRVDEELRLSAFITRRTSDGDEGTGRRPVAPSTAAGR